MHASVIELWESINRASVDWLKNVSETNKTTFDAVLGGQSSLGVWGKLAKSALDANKAFVDINTSAVNNALRSELKGQELDSIADNVEELAGIVSSLAKTLTELQVTTFNGVVTSYVSSLRSLKEAVSTEEILAVQAHLQAELQEQLTASMTNSLQTFNLLNSGLTAWVANSVERLAEDKPAGAGSQTL